MGYCSFGRRAAALLAAAACIVSWAAIGDRAGAQSAPLGGFIPFAGIGLTDRYDSGQGLSATFFLAQREDDYVGTPLRPVGQANYFDLALLDTGAATHIFTQQASGPNGFRIAGNGFDGTNTQQIGGATGLINLSINDPLAIFAAGLGDGSSNGTSLSMNTAAMRGQSSVATLSAPSAWKLPNILGLPMAAQHGIAIRNSEPQLLQHQGRTVRTPQIDFIELGTGSTEGIQRRTALKLKPGAGFIGGPLYVQDPLGILSGQPSENPYSPSVVENGGLFVGVDMSRGSRSFIEKDFLFDTGADLTVISEMTAVRLGIDPVLDAPDFVLEVEGSGGVSAGVPGYYIDELSLPTVGGSFRLFNVPVAVLDVTNPNDPGNIVDGIIGMHLFTGRDLVIDAQPSIGQGGVGPSLYIGDTAYETHAWTGPNGGGAWDADANWSGSGTPSLMWDAQVRNTAGSGKSANVTANSTVYRMTIGSDATATMSVGVTSGATLTTFGETLIEDRGVLHLAGGKLDAQFVNVDGGEIRGAGQIFVGTGPINGAVRNISGVIDPNSNSGNPAIISITGDLANLDDGTLVFDLGGTTPGTLHDQIQASRFAFLDGTLQVQFPAGVGPGPGYQPNVGDMFTLITAGEGISGQFDTLLMPAGFQWMVEYQANAVVAKVLGLASTPGDFDANGSVNAADLVVFKGGFGAQYDGSHILQWQRNLQMGAVAAVPEPQAAVLALAALFARLALRSAGSYCGLSAQPQRGDRK